MHRDLHRLPLTEAVDAFDSADLKYRTEAVRHRAADAGRRSGEFRQSGQRLGVDGFESLQAGRHAEAEYADAQRQTRPFVHCALVAAACDLARESPERVSNRTTLRSRPA
jgi:hypothetical protein